MSALVSSGKRERAAHAPRVSAVSVRRAHPERPGPPGGKRDQNRKQRVEALASAGLALFLEHGIEAVTIDDIASRAGTAKGSFYRYFEDKTELVESMFEPVIDQVRAAMRTAEEQLARATDRQSLTTAYMGLAVAFVPLALSHFDVVRLYLQEARAPGVGARAPIRRLAESIEAGAIHLTEVAVDHGLLEVSDPRISALAVIGATEQLILAVMSGRLDAPPPQIIDTLIRMVLDGIRARPT